MKVVLINRTDAIGDTLLTTSLARAIKKYHSDYKVILLVSDRSGALIELCDGVDEVFVLKLSSSFFTKLALFKEIISKYNVDYYFHLGGSFLPTFFSFLFRIKYRSGILSKIWSYLFLNCGMRQSRSKVSKHEVGYNLEFLNVLGIETNELVDADFAPLIKMKENFDSISNKPYIIVHPGMTGHTLNWPMSSYAELITKIYSKYKDNIEIIVSYTPSDLPYVNELKMYLDNEARYFDGSKKGLIHFAHVLNEAKLFIGPSTGTTHMANALNTPQVAIYSPIKVQSSERWGPVRRDDNVAIFSPHDESHAMSDILVSDVEEASYEILGRVLK
jgi:ADP-heptose:LPS heptosyltransferase